MTPAEKREIVAEVLAAIKTMSTSIPQMTPVTSVPDGAYVEINGGRKIALATIINAAADKANSDADIDGINTRIQAVYDELKGSLDSLGETVSQIPIVYVDESLDGASTNAVSNAAVTSAIAHLQNFSDAIREMPMTDEEPEFYESGVTWSDGDMLVAHTFASGDDAGKTRVMLYRRTTGRYFGAWHQAPEGLSIEEVSATSRLWLCGGNVYQGTGRDGIIQPLGAMMAQHNILSQQEYDALTDSAKDQFELYLTY